MENTREHAAASGILRRAIGALLGMRVFHHKTKHWKFKILVPMFLVMQLALAGWSFYRGMAL